MVFLVNVNMAAYPTQSGRKYQEKREGHEAPSAYGDEKKKLPSPQYLGNMGKKKHRSRGGIGVRWGGVPVSFFD